MFGNKKRIEELEQRVVEIDIYYYKKLQALEDYLNIEWKEESTKGYVKKENKGFEPEYTFIKMTPKGRKSNNKKK